MTTWIKRWWNGSPRASAHKTQQARFTLESMEAREMPAALVGNGIALPLYNGTSDTAVEIVNPATGATFYKSFPGFTGPIAVAAGDVNGDGVPDAIVAVQGSGGLVAVIDGASGNVLGGAELFPGFTGQVSVGVADLKGDGYADILIATNAPGIPVLAYDLHDGVLDASFLAAPGLSGGPVSVSGADLTGSGRDNILVGLNVPGLGGAVGVYNGNGNLATGLLAYPGFYGGVSVAGGDVNGDGRDDIVVGAGMGSPGGEVKVFSGRDLSLIDDFLPFAPSVTNGVNVYVADGTGDGQLDIFVALQGGGYPSLTGFNGKTGQLLAVGGGGAGTYSGADSGSSGDASNFNNNTDSGSDSSTTYYTGGDTGSSYTPPDTGSDSGSDGSSGDDGGDSSGDGSSDGSGGDGSDDYSDPNS